MIANLCFEFGHHPIEWPGNIKKIDKKSNTDHERRTKYLIWIRISLNFQEKNDDSHTKHSTSLLTSLEASRRLFNPNKNVSHANMYTKIQRIILSIILLHDIDSKFFSMTEIQFAMQYEQRTSTEYDRPVISYDTAIVLSLCAKRCSILLASNIKFDL